MPCAHAQPQKARLMMDGLCSAKVSVHVDKLVTAVFGGSEIELDCAANSWCAEMSKSRAGITPG